jgi:hypothetical protein
VFGVTDWSTSAATSRAAWFGVGAILLLVLLGRVKPAKRRQLTVRGLREVPRDLAVEQLPTKLYRRPPVWQRILAFVGLGSMSTVMGALIAIAVSLVAIWLVTTLTSLLK